MSENYLVINGNKTELTKEQLEQLGIKTEQKHFWKDRDIFYIDKSSEIVCFNSSGYNISCNEDRNLLPTHEHAEAMLALSQLMMKQYEANGGEIVDEGYVVGIIDLITLGIRVTKNKCGYGIRFKDRDVAKQFLKENKDLLEKVRILGVV